MNTQHCNSLSPRAMTVVGAFPSGIQFSDTVKVLSPLEAFVRVVAGQRYAEDGGELSVSCVIDVSTGLPVDDVFAENRLSLMSELDAIESVLQSVDLITMDGSADPQDSPCISRHDMLSAYSEFFGLVLSMDPSVFDGVADGLVPCEEEDCLLEFEDSRGVIHKFEPAAALLALASAVLSRGVDPAALQVHVIASVASAAVNRCTLELIGGL